MHPELSIIIPVFNEEKNIPLMHQRIKDIMQNTNETFEMIFVNDGSVDRSLDIIKTISTQPYVKYISFSRNFGHQVAVSAGLDFASGNMVVIIDCDLQDPPELILEMIEKYRQGFKVVYARRISRKGETWFKKTTANLFYRTLAKITSTKIPLDVGDYRLMDKAIVEYLKKMPEKNKFLRGQIAWIGFKQTYVDYERNERKYGETGYTFRKMVTLAMDAITSFSNWPLKVATIAGFIVSIIAFGVILYALYANLILHRTVTGWTSLIISVMFIGGIQLLCIGIIGEYISRINNQVKDRPLYIVEESTVQKSS